jgi:hypothetical protein
MSATTSIKRKIRFQVASDLHEHGGPYDTSPSSLGVDFPLLAGHRVRNPPERHLIPPAPNFQGYFDFLARMCQKFNRVIMVLKHYTHQP